MPLPLEAKSEVTTGKHGDRGRYVTTENGSQIFLTQDGQIGQTGESIDGGDAKPPVRNRPVSIPKKTKQHEGGGIGIDLDGRLPMQQQAKRDAKPDASPAPQDQPGESEESKPQYESPFVQSFAESIIANIRKHEQEQQQPKPAAPDPKQHPHHISKLPIPMRQSLLSWQSEISRLMNPIAWAKQGARGSDPKGVMKSAFDQIDKTELGRVMGNLQKLIATGDQQGVNLRPFVRHNNLVPRELAPKLKPSDLFNPVQDSERYRADSPSLAARFTAAISEHYEARNCGANAQGGGGFQSGNTCGGESGSGESVGKQKPLSFVSRAGDSFTMAKYGLKVPHKVTIKQIEGAMAKVVGENGMTAMVPTESLEQLYMDTTGDYTPMQVFGESKSPEVNKIIAGEAKFIGKGADGVVHDVGGGMVVKSSTTVPYHAVGGGQHLTVNEAIDSFAEKINLEKEMHAASIPGVMKTKNGMHGEKIFSIRPKLDVESKLDANQIKQLESSITAMHKAGYTINDEVQVGIGEDGNVYHYDLGQASSEATDSEIKSDLDRLRAFKEENSGRHAMESNSMKYAPTQTDVVIDRLVAAQLGITVEQYAARKAKNSPGQMSLFGDGLGGDSPLRTASRQQRLDWDESLVKRDPEGKFAEKAEAKADVSEAAEAKETDEERRKRLREYWANVAKEQAEARKSEEAKKKDDKPEPEPEPEPEPPAEEPLTDEPTLEGDDEESEIEVTEDDKKDIVKSSEDNAIPMAPGVSKGMIPRDVAYNAHRWSSFVPERRAEQRQSEFANLMNSKYQEFSNAAKTDEQKNILSTEWPRFLQRSKDAYMAMLHADSRTASSMITGGSNFPTERNRKRLDTAHRRLEDFIEQLKKGTSAIRKKLDPSSGGIRIGDKDSGNALENKLASLQKLQDQMKAVNVAVRKVADSKATTREETAFKSGYDQAGAIKYVIDQTGVSEKTARKVLTPDYMGRLGFPDFSIKNNGANIRRVQQQVVAQGRFEEKAQKADAGEIETEFSFNGGTVNLDYDENRIRIKHDSKPDRDTIQKLKSRGWRWSPSNSAWQRQLTRDARSSAQDLLGIKIEQYRASVADWVADQLIAAELGITVEQYAARRAKNSPGQLGLFGDGMGGDEPLRTASRQQKLDWDETKVKRDDDGKFATSAGGGASAKAEPTKNEHGAHVITQDDIGGGGDGTFDQLHAGLASEIVQSKIAIGMKGIEGREYAIMQTKGGKWQLASRAGEKAAESEVETNADVKNVSIGELRESMSMARDAISGSSSYANESEKKRSIEYLKRVATELSLMTSSRANDRDIERHIGLLEEAEAKGWTGKKPEYAKKDWQKTASQFADEKPEIEKARASDGTGAKYVPKMVGKAFDDHKQKVESAINRGENVPERVASEHGISTGLPTKESEWKSEAGAAISMDKTFTFWKQGIPYSHTKSANRSNIEVASEHLKNIKQDSISVKFSHDGDRKLAKRYMEKLQKLAETSGFEVGEETIRTNQGYTNKGDSVVELKRKKIASETTAKPKTSRDKPRFNFDQHVKIAADSIDNLRKSDVYRLIETVPDTDTAKMVADMIGQKRPDLKDEAMSSLFDYLQDAPTPGKYSASVADMVADRLIAAELGLTVEQYAARKKPQKGQQEFEWITVNADKGKGQPVMIDKKDGTIKAGMGGKFDGQKIGEIGKGGGGDAKGDASREKGGGGGQSDKVKNAHKAGLSWKASESQSGKWAWFNGKDQSSGAFNSEHDAEDALMSLDSAGGEKIRKSESKNEKQKPVQDSKEMERVRKTYANLTNGEISQKLSEMTAEISSLQNAGKREFNQNGGRRTSAAVSNEGARNVGEEKLLLSILLKERETNPDAPSPGSKDRDAAIGKGLSIVDMTPHVLTPAQAEGQAADAWYRLNSEEREHFSGYKQFASEVGKAFAKRRTESKPDAPSKPAAAKPEQSDKDKFTKAMVDIGKRDDEGSWDADVRNRYGTRRGPHFSKILGSGKWLSANDMKTGPYANDTSGGVAKDAKSLVEAGLLQMAWDKTGMPHYAKTGSTLPSGFITQADIDANGGRFPGEEPAKPATTPTPAPAPYEPPTMPGQQTSLFGGDDLNTGQKSLFNMARPSKADQRAAKRGEAPPSASLLEQIDDEEAKRLDSRKSLPGQRDMFRAQFEAAMIEQYRAPAAKKSGDEKPKKPKTVIGNKGDRGRFVTTEAGDVIFIEGKMQADGNIDTSQAVARKRREKAKHTDPDRFVPVNDEDHAIVQAVGDKKKDVAYFKQHVDNAHKEVGNRYREDADAMRETLAQFGYTGKKASGFLSSLQRRRDTANIPGFDEMLDYVQKHHRQLLTARPGESTAASDEESMLFARLKEGFPPAPKKSDPEVINAAWGMSGIEHSGMPSEWDAQETDSEPSEEWDDVPFSASPLAATERYAATFANAFKQTYRNLATLPS